MMRALLIDGGQSGCRAAYVVDGVTVDRAAGPGLPRDRRDFGVLGELMRDDVDVVAAGLTGFRGDAGAVAAALPAPRVLVSDDAVTAHLGALGGEPGVVVAAGTGAIALAVDEVAARADGWGTRLGDDGGGYWIGRRGLALALRCHDGRGGSAELLRRAHERYGLDIVAAVYDARDPVAAIAGFARDVADAAHAGDERAREIWADAGRELAHTASAAARRVGIDGPFSYAGGLFAAGELLLEPFRAALGGVQEPLGDALDGAALLLERPPFFLDLIHETGAS
jgi:N-acetylglucosamine kinase-like BadF-type ATPase